MVPFISLFTSGRLLFSGGLGAFPLCDASSPHPFPPSFFPPLFRLICCFAPRCLPQSFASRFPSCWQGCFFPHFSTSCIRCFFFSWWWVFLYFINCRSSQLEELFSAPCFSIRFFLFDLSIHTLFQQSPALCFTHKSRMTFLGPWSFFSSVGMTFR